MIEKIEEIFENNFAAYKKSIKDISYDKTNKEFLCDLPDGLYFDYDKIVEKYFDTVPSTPDLIYFKENRIIFVEFKNGKINSNSKKNLKLKGIEGAFIALHKIITKETEEDNISFNELVSIDRQYIIVYNTDKNDGKNSRVGPIRRYFNHSKIQFGLEIYENTFFENISTIGESIFVKYIARIL